MDTFALKAKDWDNPVKVAMASSFVSAIRRQGFRRTMAEPLTVVERRGRAYQLFILIASEPVL